MTSKNFNNCKKRFNTHSISILIILTICIFTGVTLAFFFASDYATKYVEMSGAVKIEAVGKGTAYNSIEDGVVTTKLEIELQDNYDVLIPGMKIFVPANCKVYKSTTKPLLRAKLNLDILHTDLSNTNANQNISSDLYSKLSSIITTNKWHLHTDAYFYYVGDVVQEEDAEGEDYVLEEIDATSNDEVIIDFINAEIDFPTTITSDYSAMGIRISIVFQAIQNYIPDNNGTGTQIPNTIKNSQKIFQEFANDALKPTALRYFDIGKVGSDNTINVKSGAVLPSTIVLPSVDEDNNPITKIGDSFAGDCGGLKKLVVPSSYTTIMNGAFDGSTIETIDLSLSNIQTIPNDCFANSSLKNIKFPATLKTINERAFQSSNVEVISLPNGCTTINDSALKNTHNLITLYIPATVTTIDEQAILSSSLQKIVVNTGNQTFYDVSDSILMRNDGYLYTMRANYPTKQFTISEGIIKLCDYSLYYSGISKLIFSTTLSLLGTNALPNLLEEVEIPSSNINYYTTDGYDVYTSSDTLVKDMH